MKKCWFHMTERETASHERAEEEQIREKNGATHKKKNHSEIRERLLIHDEAG